MLRSPTVLILVMVVACGVSVSHGGATYTLQTWLTSSTCAGSPDFTAATGPSTCVAPSYAFEDSPPIKIAACAGGYAFPVEYNDQTCTSPSRYSSSVSYSSGACYPSPRGSGSNKLVCSSDSAAQTDGATMAVTSSANSCVRPNADVSVVSANLNTCLAVAGFDAQVFYKVTSCAVGGAASVSVYTDSTCTTVATGGTNSYTDRSGCNTFPQVSGSSVTGGRFNITCYTAGNGPTGPAGSSVMMSSTGDYGSSASRMSISVLLLAALAAFSTCASSASCSRASTVRLFSVLFISYALLSFASRSIVSVEAADAITVRVWKNADCWRGNLVPGALVTSDTDSCLSIQEGGSLSYFRVTSCTGSSAVFQAYSDAACSVTSGSVTTHANSECRSTTGRSLSVTCGVLPGSSSSISLPVNISMSSGCSDGASQVLTVSGCTPVVFGTSTSFVLPTCVQSSSTVISSSLTLYTDANCLVPSAGGATQTGVDGACTPITGGSQAGSYFVLQQQTFSGGSGYQCSSGQASGATVATASFILIGSTMLLLIGIGVRA